ncbi:NAD(P)-dependent oxidoreductase [Paraburkholderia sp. J12]|uniref:NAD-dependent epimerase/dehydratase family protein n=1 Tax=Paraburkholderia sp. J12 TaxID=2805432 RepID=UPI002ABE0EE0|nr:NAD(P)-dependent oxidoreductase [Paraburkholderia sp. J12]
MNRKVFLAGATGAIGRALAPLLVEGGYTVFGTTRRAERAAELEKLGVVPVLVDVFDAPALHHAVERIGPASVIHQLTDLPAGLPPEKMAQAVAPNARIRDEGTRNLIAAAVAAGATKLVAQSIAWAWREGAMPYRETQPLDTEATGARRVTVDGVVSLERQVLEAPLTGTVLRYGQLYGPGTGTDEPRGASPVHVEAAAWAARLALERSPGGIFNITEETGVVSAQKAARELGWSPAMRGSLPDAAR